MLTDTELQAIIELAKQSNAHKISGVEGVYLVGGDIDEHYQHAKFSTFDDATYAAKLLPAGAEMAAEILRLREWLHDLLRVCNQALLELEWLVPYSTDGDARNAADQLRSEIEKADTITPATERGE